MQNDALMLQDQPSAPASAQVGQALLFSRDVELEIVKEERQGRYTLERFRVLRPEALNDCVALLAAAKPGYEGLRRIATLVGVHHLTVAAVRDDADAAKTIDTLRERLSKKMLTAVELLVDRVLDSPGSIPAGMLGMVADQLAKSAELLGNRATGRVEHTERVDIYAHYEEVLQQLEPGEPKQLDSDSVREIGLGGGKMAAIEAASEGAASEGAAGAPDRELGARQEAQGDAQSPVLTTDARAEEQGDTASDTEANRSPAERNAEDGAPDARNEGGRGSANSMGGGFSRSGYSKRNFSGNGPLQPPPI